MIQVIITKWKYLRRGKQNVSLISPESIEAKRQSRGQALDSGRVLRENASGH